MGSIKKTNTYAGLILLGAREKKFEKSGISMEEVRKELKRQYPKGIVVFKEYHSSVYTGKLGKPNIKKIKDGVR